MSLLIVTAMASGTPAMDKPNLEAMSNSEIREQASSLHPAALYILSARLLAEGRGQEAANWMYAGQLRYRFLIEAGGDAARDENVLFSALTEQVGRPVNEYIAGNVDEWLAAMQWALDWDEANANGLTSKTQHAAVLKDVRDGLERLMADVEANRAEIPAQREANGLENR
ncbi:hypothetical protein [Devosia lucknowensis]|nr:hypothetical protein [Devosia lucknowensis]